MLFFLEYNQREATSFANHVFSAHRREGQAGEGAQAQTGESPYLDLHVRVDQQHFKICLLIVIYHNFP